jgi:hypothetical protein
MCRTWLRVAVSASFLVALGAPGGVSAEPSAKASIDSFFVKIKGDFDKVAASAIVRRPAVTPVNSYFLKQLQAHRPYHSLIRTDAKGMVINERVRLVKEPGKKWDASAEPWFKHVKTTHEEYAGRVKLEEMGRYYLVWAAPILSNDPAGKEQFMGAVMLRVDLWDCFQRYSKVAASPFLVRMGHLYLYSHNWSDTIGYAEEAVTIPGGRRIYVRSPEAAPEPDTMAAAVGVAESTQAVAPEKAKSGAGGWIVFLLIIAVLETTALAFYVIKPLAALREKWLARNTGGFA